MREIKFRGKDLSNNWRYGGISINEDRVWIDQEYFGDTFVDKETIGQYTGLKDKNGKEIYEGDILIDDEDEIAIVQYSEVDAMFEIILDNIVTNFSNESSEWWRIIGNIYDNPDLLKERE